jgi:hypothetical protein
MTIRRALLAGRVFSPSVAFRYRLSRSRAFRVRPRFLSVRTKRRVPMDAETHTNARCSVGLPPSTAERKTESRYWVPATQTATNGVSGGPHEALLSFENNAGVRLGPQ